MGMEIFLVCDSCGKRKQIDGNEFNRMMMKCSTAVASATDHPERCQFQFESYCNTCGPNRGMAPGEVKLRTENVPTPAAPSGLVCPACQRSQGDHPVEHEPDHVCICIGCGALLVFETPIRIAKDDDLAKLPNSDRRELARVTREVRERIALMRAN